MISDIVEIPLKIKTASQLQEAEKQVLLVTKVINQIYCCKIYLGSALDVDLSDCFSSYVYHVSICTISNTNSI